MEIKMKKIMICVILIANFALAQMSITYQTAASCNAVKCTPALLQQANLITMNTGGSELTNILTIGGYSQTFYTSFKGTYILGDGSKALVSYARDDYGNSGTFVYALSGAMLIIGGYSFLLYLDPNPDALYPYMKLIQNAVF